MTVNGNNFIPSSTIQWDGTALATSYLSENQLEAQIPTANVAASGFAEITVVNPAPGGGASSPQVFTIAYASTLVSQVANDLVWDPKHQLIYLSVPGLGGLLGNTVAALNPTMGNIQLSQFAGSEPDRLAISDDDQYLYAGIDGSSSVQRFLLPSLTPDVYYSLGADQYFGPQFAVDLGVAPGLPHTTAVSRGVSNVSPYAQGGVAIYDDATQRSTIADFPGNLYDSLQWGSDTAIYANNGEVASFDLYVLTVSSSGVVQGPDYRDVFTEFYISIHYDSGTQLVYGDDGTVVNPANGQHVGSFPASGWVIPDSGLNSAFFLGQTQFQSGTNNFTIESFDLTTFAPVAEIAVPNVQGTPLRFIRWGANGLAFNDDAGYVYILNNPFVAADRKRVVTPQRYLSPVAKTRSARRMLRPSQVVAYRRAKNKLTSKVQPFDAGVPNPAPTVMALSPNVVTAGVNGLTLTVSGSNFVSLSTIEWNGTQVPTEFVSSSELQGQISAADILTAGSAPVDVVTPSPGGGTSTALTFNIVPSFNPVPILTSLDPNYVVAGSPGFTMDINGYAYFNASSVVEWNGSPMSAYLYTPGQLQVQVSASEVATPGLAEVTVTNPSPGGGTSNTAVFQTLYQPTVVNQTATDMVWDSLNQVFYISVPSSASTHANQVCALNPTTMAISKCQTGNEPDVLAVSDDSQFLYVGMDGTSSVQRFTLPSLTPNISYSLGSESGTGAPYYALDLQVAPGAPHTTAVSLGTDTDPRATGGITIYDDSTPRPTSAPGWGPTSDLYDSLQWGADATELYAASSEGNGDFYTLTVNSSGVVLDQDYPGVFWNPGKIHYDATNGLIYSDDGFHVINPATGLPVGIFEVGGGWPMAPDSTLNTVFILLQYVWQLESPNYTINLFDMTHYRPVAQIPFATQTSLLHIGRFIRWGSNGLALNDTQGNIYLISSSFVSAASKSPSQMRARWISKP
ncbi:MAG: IPT/TIG domain-containing protein [Candidatus Sulfotelmatobacter sp.]